MPVPCSFVRVRLPIGSSGAVVADRRAAISVAFMPGFLAATSAAAALTYGVAIDVPLQHPYILSERY